MTPQKTNKGAFGVLVIIVAMLGSCLGANGVAIYRCSQACEAGFRFVPTPVTIRVHRSADGTSGVDVSPTCTCID